MSTKRSRYCITALLAALPLLTGTGAFVAPVHASGLGPGAVVQAAPASAAPASSHALSREVFGFALASSLTDPSIGYASWNFSLLSTVAFFGLHVNSAGALVNDSGYQVWSSSALTGLLNSAHATGTRVVLAIILQDFSPGTPSMCAGLINRATTVKQTVAEVVAKRVDGVNVDYEGLNGVCQNGQTSRSMLTDFARQLRAGLPAGSYLSFDTYASSASDSLGFFDVRGLNAYVDSFFVMAYDLEYSNWRYPPLNCIRFCLGPTAPLSGYFYNDTSAMSQYVSAVPASKVILGVPYYGRKACVSGAIANAYAESSVAADSYLTALGEATDPAVRAGTYVVHGDLNDGGREQWDTWYNTSLGCTRELYWDDASSLGAKYDLVNRDGLRGVGIWTLNYGGSAPELWAELSSHFRGCKSVSVGASALSPQPVGTLIDINALASGCPDANPLYQFWVLAPGASAWTVAQAYSTSTAFRWATTTSQKLGVYRFSVWARDASGTTTYDAYNASFTYTLTYRPCSSLAVTSSPGPSASVGTAVKVDASATNCPNPRYEFWLMPPGASTWQQVQAYGAAAGFSWSTAGRARGVYRFSVWAKDALSTAAYDAFNAAFYVTLVVPCVAVTVAVSPSSPATSGTAVAVSAVAKGCPDPVYEFWVMSPGSSTWLLAQSYSAAAAYRWNNAGDGAGAYRFSVWARDVASPAGYDAFDASKSYTLTAPCTSVAVAATPAGSLAVGQQANVRATVSGCASPLYEFWVLAPGASAWQLAQAYSPTASLSWSTKGIVPGVYRFSVWAKDSASHAPYDAFNASRFLTLVRPCASVSVKSSPSGAVTPGTAVTLTASASACTSPLYEFWILPPGATTWRLAQAYTSSPVYRWSTTGGAAGAYRFSIWVKDAGSASPYDAFDAGTYVSLT